MRKKSKKRLRKMRKNLIKKINEKRFELKKVVKMKTGCFDSG